MEMEAHPVHFDYGITRQPSGTKPAGSLLPKLTKVPGTSHCLLQSFGSQRAASGHDTHQAVDADSSAHQNRRPAPPSSITFPALFCTAIVRGTGWFDKGERDGF
ncbi:hypothetical protein B296_00023167 [Ensete ventricosum]|uniref:Uncharacterized protein n=1 Tax=Ensete ventricosum TaxID=4639 RepID=A0A427ABJ2_ENSVE|nr:hypothetical protein B296_00023167 [Ensete ventricosum]